jgi:hypothetical protein
MTDRVGQHSPVRHGRRIAEVGLQLAGAVLLVSVSIVLLPIPWHSVLTAAGERWPVTTAAAMGIGCAGVGLVLAERRRRRLRRWALRALPWWFAALSVVIVVAAGAIALSVLLGEAGRAGSAQQPQLRIEAIRTGLSVAAGFGAGIALLLAMRRSGRPNGLTRTRNSTLPNGGSPTCTRRRRTNSGATRHPFASRACAP